MSVEDLTPNEQNLLIFILDKAGSATTSYKLLQWREQVIALKAKMLRIFATLPEDPLHG